MQVRSDPHRLGLQRHAITLGHRFLDRPRQRHDVGRRGPAPVHQHQRLAVVHASRAQAAPFQPHWSINQPAASL